jgi:hypothetical protein
MTIPGSDQPTRTTRWPVAFGAAVCVAASLASWPAEAVEFTLHAEPAAAFWVDQPQSDRFTPGGYVAVRPGLSLGRHVALQWSYAFLVVPAGPDFDALGTAHSLTAGVRVRPLAGLRPESEQLGGLFADFNIGYVRTGDLDRFGLDGGIGYGFQVAPWMSIGPVVRYTQIFQPDRLVAFTPDDAQYVSVGIDFGFGPAPREQVVPAEHPPVEPAKECPECVQVAAKPRVDEPTGCRDYDRDGVCDEEDKCPTLIGPPATLGCPIDPCSGAPLVVLVQFPYDSSDLPEPRDDAPQTMDPVLDAVAKAIAQDPSCRVCIIGHASEEGPVDYNDQLSSRRASAVERYLNARGLAGKKMPTVGLGSRCQLVPEVSRPLNRRVEFRRLQEGESCPTDCSQ